MKNLRVGIIGGGGYTAGELIRLLTHHPHAKIAFVLSKSQAGKPISEVHQDLIGACSLVFSNTLNWDIDVLFLCMGHGASATFLQEQQIPDHITIIDLSRDYRLTGEFVYGLPELNRPAVKAAKRIANPGCFATALQLGLLPLANAKLLRDTVHIHAMTGSTGAGQSPSATTHFSWRQNNVSVYKPFRHQHLAEIKRSLIQLQQAEVPEILFLPIRGTFTRGIFASIHLPWPYPLEEAERLFQSYYQDHPFTFISASNPHLKQVVNTNKCILHLVKEAGQLLIISMIDNLLKGASGQAVQNMNIAFGLEESSGLNLKAAYF